MVSLMQPPPKEQLSSSFRSVSPIGREDVEGQRAGASAHEGNDLIQRFIRQHRQDGAENLLLHDGGIRGDIGKQRRLDEAARVVVAAAEGDGLILQQAEEAAVVLFGDDGGHVRIVAGGEKLLEGGAERLDKGLLDGLVDEEIVWLHAGLTGVQYLAKGDAAGGASWIFAVASTMTGLLPPSSSVTGVRCLAAASITTLPTATEPVKKM